VSGLPPGVTATGSIITLNPNNAAIASSPTTSSSPTLSLTSSTDNDGDGVTNASEVAAGTNPLDNSSYFRITSITPQVGVGITVTWDPVVGKTYTVQAATNLATGNWTTLASGLTSGSYTDTNPVTGPKFYRVKTP
jgi:hypothetical protein